MPLFLRYVPLLMLFAFSGAAFAWQQTHAAPIAQYATPEEADKYVRFDMEAYDLIEEHYVLDVPEADLSRWFLLSMQNVTGSTTLSLSTSTRSGVAKLLSEVLAGKNDEEKKKITTDSLRFLLANIPPGNRGMLLSEGGREEFINNVNNVNPEKDLYQTLGVSKGASVAAVQEAFQEKKAVLSATTSESGKQELAKATQAHEILADTVRKTVYDETGAEPTVFSRIIGRTLYIDMRQMGTATVMEFNGTLESASSTPLDSMIIDLRGNLGGNLEIAQLLLALFLGPDQYAFDMAHQGEKEVQRTKPVGPFETLKRYEGNIALLTDGQSRSTSEVLAAAFKRSRLGYVVGAKTAGWGTVEMQIPMVNTLDEGEKYWIILVSHLTLRDDQTPIQDNGVIPNVDISKTNWRSELPRYFDSASLIAALRELADKPPKR